MNDQSSNSGVSATNDPLSPQRSSLSADALMRRRLMLKGASGGAAALAALQPIGALATSQSTVLTCLNAKSKESLCSISGVNSAAHSFGPNVLKIQAKGNSNAYWRDYRGDKHEWIRDTKLSDLFVTPAPANGTKTLRAVLTEHPTSIEADFIGAYLNGYALYATTPYVGKSFPYSKEQVQELWKKDADTRAKAQALFRGISL